MDNSERKPDPPPGEVVPITADAYTEQDVPEPSGWNRRNWFLTSYLEMLDREKG